tara:strand:- start:54 stop:371 length:318 start_codon:yes stop_codon:yes gene_type:complete
VVYFFGVDREFMRLLKLITSAMLFLAILELPYGYYNLLRLVVTISGGISSFNAFKNKNEGIAIIFGIICLLFNPIFPIYMIKDDWILIDFIVGIFFLVSGLREKD